MNIMELLNMDSFTLIEHLYMEYVVELPEAIITVEDMQEAGSIDYARNYAENLTSIAKNRIIDMLPATDARNLLISMADWFVSRLH